MTPAAAAGSKPKRRQNASTGAATDTVRCWNGSA